MKPQLAFYILLSSLLLIILASGAGFYLLNNVLNENGITLADKEKKLDEADKQLQYLQGLESDTEAAKRAVGAIDEVFPESKLQVEFIDQIYRLEQINGVDLPDQISFEFNDETPTDSTQTSPSELVSSLVGMQITFRANGTYNEVVSFIRDLEEFRRLVLIEDLKLSGDSGDFNADITLRILVDQAPPAPKPAEGEEGAEGGGAPAPATSPEGGDVSL